MPTTASKEEPPSDNLDKIKIPGININPII